MSDLGKLLIVLFAVLGGSLALLWWMFKPRITRESVRGIEDADDQRGAGLKKLPAALERPVALEPGKATAPSLRLQTCLFAIGLIVYVVTRFVGLERFPITFFADEAASTVIAAELLENGLRYEGEFLPTYFLNVDKYSLSVTVYLQTVPYLLFGKSVLVTRALSVMVGLIGVLAVSITLKEIFNDEFWWSGVAWLLIAPAWFMHSRTAFETPMASAFFALFILCYLLYLYGSPAIFPFVVITAALTFYTYNPARVITAASILLLSISDRRYHWANRSLIKRYWWLVLLCLLPYIRLFFQHPYAASDQLLLLNSYWVQDLSIPQKLLRFLGEFGRGLNPLYWYFPHQEDLARHTMKGYGHILWIMLPLVLRGLFIAWKRRRIAAYRALLIVLICAPLGGAIVETAVTRSLPVIIPVILLTALGFSNLMKNFIRTDRLREIVSLGVVVLSVSLAAGMTVDALRNGPTWYTDYGLYGMQYGSPEVFETIEEFVNESPGRRVIVSPFWANGTSVLARFFLDDLEPLWWGVITEFLEQDYPFNPDDLFVMLPHEYEQALAHKAVREIHVEKILYYPDGRPGFYFGEVDLAEPAEEGVMNKDVSQ